MADETIQSEKSDLNVGPTLVAFLAVLGVSWVFLKWLREGFEGGV